MVVLRNLVAKARERVDSGVPLPVSNNPVERAERIKEIMESIKYAISLRNRLAEAKRLDEVIATLKAATLLPPDATVDEFQLEIEGN